ncbi:MAG: PEGA domain-containing protein [Candidatus Aminicenantes bacterium]|nr:PEGA domain-containing protein [Candidatus Aminicenantes bacterium]
MTSHRFRPVLALLLAAAAIVSAQEASQTDPAAEIAAQIEAVRGLLREGGSWAEALNRLTSLLARLLAVPETGKRIELSADVFLLRGIASAGLGDEEAALREFRSLYALGPDIARAATKNVFDPKILPLLTQAERESRGEETGYFLAVLSEPVGASVSVNGREIGAAPVLFQATGPEKVIVELSLAGYQPVREEVELRPGGTRREFALVPISLSLRVRSTPPGAKIFLDGEETGQVTEAEIVGLRPGRHTLRLKLPGYRDWETDFEASVEKPGADAETRLIPSSYDSKETWGGLESPLLKSPAFLASGPSGGFIVADASEDRLKVLDDEGRIISGPDGGTLAESGLSAVNGLAVDPNGRILVSDPENHVVFLLQPDGRLVSRWGSFGAGPGEFNTPAGLVVDDVGTVYIADTGNDRIQLRSLDGIPAGNWGGKEGGTVSFQSPRAVTVQGDRVYILDLRRVHILAKDGTLQASWEPKGEGGEALSSLTALAVDEDKCIFLADMAENRILKYDSAGEFICAWGRTGSGEGEMDRPCGLVCNLPGRVCVLENGNHRIQVFQAGIKPPDGRMAGHRLAAGQGVAVELRLR